MYPLTTDQEQMDAILLALLELFAEVDTVFFQDDAFAPPNMKYGFGRIYRAWKTAHMMLDPDFNMKRKVLAHKNNRLRKIEED